LARNVALPPVVRKKHSKTIHYHIFSSHSPSRLPPTAGPGMKAPATGGTAMAEIRTIHLMTMTLAVSGMQSIGATPNGDRRVDLVAGGKFEGPKLRGTVLPGGADWIIARSDGSTTLDVRIVLQTDDGAAIGMTYRGMRHGPAAVMQRVNSGEFVDPSEYYFRTAVAFETAAPKYDRLNRIIAVGTGSRPPEGPVYDIFEVL
jgi:hypothetical protein